MKIYLVILFIINLLICFGQKNKLNTTDTVLHIKNGNFKLNAKITYFKDTFYVINGTDALLRDSMDKPIAKARKLPSKDWFKISVIHQDTNSKTEYHAIITKDSIVRHGPYFNRNKNKEEYCVFSDGKAKGSYILLNTMLNTKTISAFGFIQDSTLTKLIFNNLGELFYLTNKNLNSNNYSEIGFDSLCNVESIGSFNNKQMKFGEWSYYKNSKLIARGKHIPDCLKLTFDFKTNRYKLISLLDSNSVIDKYGKSMIDHFYKISEDIYNDYYYLKTGKWYYFYDDGSIEKIEYYDKGIVRRTKKYKKGKKSLY